jgi:2',3'-cyclic-nucleotide 2'-phosphodiesterase (5'-nucleotidase family)
MLDETVVIEATGAQLLGALENGVSQWPALEGRFLQVSGVAFAFDPARPPGARVVEGSARAAGAPLEPARRYKVATKEFLFLGKDGFDVLTVRTSRPAGLFPLRQGRPALAYTVVTVAGGRARAPSPVDLNRPETWI